MQDVTYKTNMDGLFLSVFVAVDGNLNTRLVAQALLSRQKTEDHKRAFSALRVAIDAARGRSVMPPRALPAKATNALIESLILEHADDDQGAARVPAQQSTVRSNECSDTPRADGDSADSSAAVGLNLNPETLIKDATLNLTRDFEGFVVITDFDQAAQKAVEAVFPRGQRIGCRWHMDVVVDTRDSGRRRAVPRTADDPPFVEGLRKAARNFLRRVNEARTEEECNRLWNQKPQDLDDRVYEYPTRTWYTRRRLWASWAIGTFFRAGSTTSSRVEGMNGLMKSFGLNTNSRLVHVDDAVGLELVREANQVGGRTIPHELQTVAEVIIRF
ncbi:hypothetical protein H9P43_007081 [Blastocladiella emersonii ATCC 22665]|nr:hypothetical protein H9P43_007081 [Blastocladiella emersonii ATCC 22665]